MMDIKLGQRVRVPKGTSVLTTCPSKKAPVTGRNMIVTVNHVLPAWKYMLATRYGVGSDNVRLHFEGNWRDQYTVCEDFDLPRRNDAEVQASLESFVAKATIESPYEHGHIEHLWIERQPARVVWAGSGGYWREVPLSAVIPV